MPLSLFIKLGNQYGPWYLHLPFKHERGDILLALVSIDRDDVGDSTSLAQYAVGKEKINWIAAREYELKMFAYENHETYQVVFCFAINLTSEQATEYYLYWT